MLRGFFMVLTAVSFQVSFDLVCFGLEVHNTNRSALRFRLLSFGSSVAVTERLFSPMFLGLRVGAASG
jgi:hypothetical protein